MNKHFTEVDTVINDSYHTHFYVKYFTESCETCKHGMIHLIDNKLKIVYDSHNGSNSSVKLYCWNSNNGWVLFADDNTCNNARIAQYTASKHENLKAFEESCDALLELWEKLH